MEIVNRWVPSFAMPRESAPLTAYVRFNGVRTLRNLSAWQNHACFKPEHVQTRIWIRPWDLQKKVGVHDLKTIADGKLGENYKNCIAVLNYGNGSLATELFQFLFEFRR